MFILIPTYQLSYLFGSAASCNNFAGAINFGAKRVFDRDFSQILATYYLFAHLFCIFLPKIGTYFRIFIYLTIPAI